MLFSHKGVFKYFVILQISASFLSLIIIFSSTKIIFSDDAALLDKYGLQIFHKENPFSLTRDIF